MMRSFLMGALLAALGCSSAPSTEPGRTSTSLSAATFGDSADASCQVVLRTTALNFQGRLGPQTDCSSGTCWVMIWVTFDVAMSQSLVESGAYVLYQGEGSTAWRQSRKAAPIFGAPVGFRRYEIILDSGTFQAGPGTPVVTLIPFLQVTSGGRLFDHNRIPDPLGAYALTPSDNWTINDDGATCKGSAPASTLSLGFAKGWSNSASGTLQPGGKIDVTYDAARLPQTLACTYNGLPAFATMAYVQFEPGGQVLSERVAPYDTAPSGFTSAPLEFDVPGGTRSASLWFESSSDCGGGAYWDSDFGQNYQFFVP